MSAREEHGRGGQAPLSLTVVILTFNEEIHIARCIESVRAIAERGQGDGDRADPVVEIGAERLARDGLEEIVVRRPDEPHVHHALADVAHPSEALLLEDLEELGLHLGVEVPDLVEEQAAAVGRVEQALLGGEGAGEGAALVPEELGLDELPGEPGAVDVDERALGAGADGVDPPREDALAGPGLPEQEHRAVGVPEPRDLVLDAVHGERSRHEGVERAAPGRAGGAALDRAPDDVGEQVDVHRLGQEVVGAALDRADREVDRPVAGHDVDGDGRVGRAHPPQEVERVPVGEPEVGHDRVEPGAPEPLERAREGRRLEDDEPRGLERRRDRHPHARLVLDEQERRRTHPLPPGHHLRHEAPFTVPRHPRRSCGPSRGARPARRSWPRAGTTPRRDRRSRSRSAGRSTGRARSPWAWW